MSRLLRAGGVAVTLSMAMACSATTDAPKDGENVEATKEDLDVHPNYALGGYATQSSVGWGGVPSRAIDGNTDGNFFDNSVTHTNNDNNAWWQVDLGAPPPEQGSSRFIDTVEIWNRTDCCSERLNNFFVFAKETPFIATSPADLLNEDGVTWKAVWGVPANPVSVSIGAKARYIRIQLGGTGYLSLAEVRVFGPQTTVLGPPGLAAQNGWAPTGSVTDDTALAAADVQGTVHSFFRGSDGLLHDAADVAGAGMAVPGSPALTTDGVSAVFDAASNNVFVAVPTAQGPRLAQGTAANGAISGWTWLTSPELSWFGVTTGRPALTLGCGRVALAATAPAGSLVATRPTGGGAWTLDGTLVASVGPTSLASNGRGDILAAVVGKADSKVHVATRTCSNGVWSTTTTLNSVGWPLSRVSLDNKVGLTAIGNRFAVGIRGDGNAPLMMMQSAGTNDAPAWPTAFEAIGLNTTVIEAPTLFTFRGIVMAAARGPNNSAYYALRNPNTVAYRSDRPMWTGGRIISGWGVGAVPPLFVAAGRRTLSAGDYSPLPNVPDDLYVLTKGIGDRQIYGINFGSFASLDVMQNVYGVHFEADDPINAVPNMWDQLQGFLSSPSAYWSEQGAPTSCNPAQFTTVYLSSRYGEVTFEGCNYPRRSLRLDDRGGAASFMWQEWGHVISWGTAGFKTSNFESIFNVLKPKTCSKSADCGGGTCATVQSGSTAEGNVGKGALVCYSDSSMQRYQGFVWYWGTGWDYDMTVDEHSFLDFATFYRWWGDELRAWVAQDNAQGNGLLAQKYAWIRDHFYGGVEFNGSRAISGNAATSDESVGAYGMPLQ